MIGKIEDILEDAENGLSLEFRQVINVAKSQFECVVKTIANYDRSLKKSIQTHPDCKNYSRLKVLAPLTQSIFIFYLDVPNWGHLAKERMSLLV